MTAATWHRAAVNRTSTPRTAVLFSFVERWVRPMEDPAPPGPGRRPFEVVGESGTGRDAVSCARRLRPQVVLMDLRLGGGSAATDDGNDDGNDGIEATRQITRSLPDTRVVMLTSSDNRSAVVRAIDAGARGYVLKAGRPDDLFSAIRAAAAGGMVLAPEVAEQLAGRRSVADPDLSEREMQVVRLLAEGRTNRDIGTALFLSEATIKTHLVRIYRKLGTENRVGAVSEAVRRGLIDAP